MRTCHNACGKHPWKFCLTYVRTTANQEVDPQTKPDSHKCHYPKSWRPHPRAELYGHQLSLPPETDHWTTRRIFNPIPSTGMKEPRNNIVCCFWAMGLTLAVFQRKFGALWHCWGLKLYTVENQPQKDPLMGRFEAGWHWCINLEGTASGDVEHQREFVWALMGNRELGPHFSGSF